MKDIRDYKEYIFIGGGCMAHRLKKQFDEYGMKLAGVIDLLDDDKRKVTEFEGKEIHNPDYYRYIIETLNVAVVIALNGFYSVEVINQYLNEYNLPIENLYVPNPYTTLRPCVMNDEFAAEIRIPVSDKRYKEVLELFSDELSEKIFNLLLKGKTYDNAEDACEIIPYSEVKDMYWQSEDYWLTYDFSQLQKQEQATVLDCGAYIGDSILKICNSIPCSDIYYYAFEPDNENADQIEKSDELKKTCKELRVLRYGCGENDAKLYFSFPSDGCKDGGRFSENPSDENDLENELQLEIKKIDGLDLKIHGQLFIKMDIEGSELGALKGAEQLIRKNRPYLAICVYHRKNDLLNIPLYLKKICPDYSFYLRGGFHTIFWAIPNN